MNEPPSITRTNPSAAKHLPKGKVLSERYRLDGIVGVGGMGVVYAAHDLELDLPVAVKVLRPEMADDERLKERFRRELILARQVSHRNVVRIHDLYRDGDLRYLTMDLVHGRSLRALLREEGPMPAERVVPLALQLARALAAAHEQGVVHRDLKPANVLMETPDETGGEVARITDFGIARSIGVAASGLTATGTVVGSLEYLSPEQAVGGEVDGRSDIYSLGLILYEMLTGELPFEPGSDLELIAQRISSSPSLAALVEVPAWMREVLRKMLQRDPEKRYVRAEDVVRDLESRSIAGTSGPPRKTLIVASALLLVAAGALGFWLWRMTGPGTSAEILRNEITGAEPGNAAERSMVAPSYSVAVLPLARAEGRDDLAWTSRGAAESLSHALAESRDLRVVDSFRVFRLLDDLGLRVGVAGLSDGERSDVAKLLGVDRLIYGSVRPAEAGLQLSLALQQIDPGGGKGGGATRLSGSGTDLSDAVARLSGEIRRALRAQDPDMEYQDEAASPAARVAYDRGVEALLAGDGTEAAELLRSAVDTSPAFVAAWMRLSDAYAGLGRFEEAEAAIRRAAELAGSGTGRRSLEIAARQADLRGEAERAQELWQRLVYGYPQDVEARIRLAMAHGDAGALEQARELLLDVVAVDAKHPRAWYLLSKYTIQAGDLRTAVDEYLVHALVIQNQLDNDQGRADVLNAMGVAYDRLGRIDLAEERYREAAELRRRAGDLRGYATSLRNLGALAAVRGDYDAAEERYDQAADALEDLGDRYGLASLASRRGLLAEERGEYHGALEHYRRALQMRRDLGDTRVLVESYNNVGYAYFLLGDYDNASVYWHQALDEVATGGNRQGEVFVRQSLGQLYLAQGRWDDATRAFLDALEVSRELDMPDTRAVSQGYLGRLAQLQGRYAAALEAYGLALDLVRELEDPRGLAEFGLLRAESLFELGDESAAAALEVVRDALAAAENREQAALLDVLEARMALRRGDSAQAAEHAARARDDAQASHSVVADWRSRWIAAELDLADGRPEAAVVTLEALRDEAATLGHSRLRLSAAESLGRALLAVSRHEAARSAFRAGLSVLSADMQYADAYLLHLGLAEAHRKIGDGEAADTERQRARAEIERLRSDMPPEHRTSFDRLGEVARLGG